MEQPARKFKIGDFVLIWYEKPGMVIGYNERDKLYSEECYIDATVYGASERSLTKIFVEYNKLWRDLCQ